MNKQAPSLGRILIAVGFTLSCFGLILFLWVAFGGPIPLKAESYRITAYFPEATQLAVESDVRIGGVSVGKVKAVDLAPIDMRVNGKDTTEAEIEIDAEFAPIATDSQAILRQKTLLGETFVELTSGTSEATDEDSLAAAPVSLGTAAASSSDAESKQIEALPEGGTLGIGQTTEAGQIDELFNALDAETRNSFQEWMANSAVAIDGRAQDLNDALGNLGPFASDASDVLATLRQQRVELKGLVRDTGTVFEALTADEEALAGAILGSNETFEAIASEQQALADTFAILPTFQRESRVTLRRLDEFQQDTQPLVNQLIPVARDLSPTLASIRKLAPNLRSLFPDLDRLRVVSQRGSPALSSTIRGLDPVLKALDPFLANLTPLLSFLEYQKKTFADFFTGPSAALAGSLPRLNGQPARRAFLRQTGYNSPEAASVLRERLDTNRGNAYLQPGALTGRFAVKSGIFESWDCVNTDFENPLDGMGDPDEDPVSLGERPPPDVNNGRKPGITFAPCVIGGDFPSEFGGERNPQVFQDP
ncbi:MAG: MCE family protein [Solirubrobacterales bacterium]|nr:MCE family protein [Solirubrobacterales bacterium]